MPWTVADVDRHKKGLTDKQKRQWVAVANSALASCLKDKREQKVCEASAIKQANSVVGTPQKASIAGDNISGNLMHGDGGILNPMRDGAKVTCVCTKCGYKQKSKDSKCADKCPKCGAKMKIEEKARSKNPSDYLVVEDKDRPSTWHLPVKRGGKPDHNLMGAAWAALHGGYRGNKYKGPNKAAALKKLIALYKSEGMPLPTEQKFISYKISDGNWGWVTISNVAIEDKEQEVVSEKAYDDGIAHAHQTGQHGGLDLVHVAGTDVGSCDMMLRLGNRLVEGGKWFNTERAKKVREIVAADPDYWGVSIKFQFDPEQFDGRTYLGGIQILNRTILPRHMAASWGTAIAVSGGQMNKQIDEETKVALGDLGLKDEEIDELNKAQKALPPLAENIVEKQEDKVETEDESGDEVSFWDRMRKTVALVVGTKEATDEDAADTEATEPVVAEQQKAEQEVPSIEEASISKAVAGMSELFVTSATEAVLKGLAPMEETLSEIKLKMTEMEERLTQAEKLVEDKVLERLDELPPVVKARITELKPAEITTLPPVVSKGDDLASILLADISSVVKGKLGSGQYQV